MVQNSDHFKHTYYFVCAVVGIVLCYIFAVTFLHIPKENVRNADTALAYLLGLASGAAAFLIGSGPGNKKTDPTPGTTTTDITVTKTENKQL